MQDPFLTIDTYQITLPSNWYEELGGGGTDGFRGGTLSGGTIR